MDEARYFIRVVVTRENRSDEPCTLKAEISARDSELEIPVTESPTEVQVLRRGESKRFFHFALQGTNEYIVGFVSKLETSAGERNSFEFGTNIPDARGESWRALVNGLRSQYASVPPNASDAVESSSEWQNPHLIRELLTTHSRNRRTNWKPQITPSLISDLPAFDIFAQSSKSYTWPAFTVDLEVPDDYSFLDFIDATATLAMEFESQSTRDGRPSDATIALFFHWLAVNASYGDRFPVIHLSSVSRLAAFVTVRYRQIHRLLELREVIRLLQSSIDSYDLAIGYKQRDELISALAILLCEALSTTGTATEDVESATVWCTQHIIPSPPQGSAGLNNFAQLYMQRYECLGGLDDLNINIDILQTAISSPPPDLDNSERAFILHNMTRSLHCRYISLRQHTDLELALRYCQESLDMEASGVKLVPRWELLSTLGEIIKESDPEGALNAFRESKQLCPPNDPLRYLVLHRLAMALRHSNITHGQQVTENEEESKALEAEALLLIPNGNRLTKTDMLLNNIQQELPNVRSRARIASDFDDSIAKAVDILQIAGDLPIRHAPLYIVGTLHYGRFILSKESHDIAEAHRYLNEALQVASTGPGISNRANILARLARIHLQRGTKFFDPEVAYGYLGMCLEDTHCTAAARLEYVARSMHGALRDLAQEIDISDLLPSRLADVYIKAVHIFSEVAPLNVDLMSSLEVLRKWGHFVLHASMLCHLSNRTTEAIQTLEEGRAAFWSQILQTRVAAPKGIPVDLGNRLLTLSRQVEHIRFHKISPSLSPVSTLEYTRRMRIWEEYSSLVKEIRGLPEATEFLSVPLEDIVSSSKHGPVVILFSYTFKTVAYIMHRKASNPHDPFTIGVKSFNVLSHPVVQEYITQLHQANRHARGDMNRTLGIPVDKTDGIDSSESSPNRDGERAVRMRPRNKDAFVVVVKNLWIQLVKPILDALDIKPSKARKRPRIWWCPTGDLAFLPIHAAGDYSPGGECCADYVVSSYTPTVTALTTARKVHEPIRKADLRVLLTGAPHPYQGSPLYETVKELNRVAQTIPPNQLIPLPPSDDVLLDPRAGLSVPTALAKLPDASILHLASHGIQDFENPLNSGFLLRDAKLSIAQLMPLPLPYAFLAFLSACETARGDQEYNDQVVHLAATLLFAGFKSVIGTMWSMSDIDGPVVASHVYKRIFSEDAEYLDPDIVPYALDEAVQELRAKGVSPSRWSTFIHLGI